MTKPNHDLVVTLLDRSGSIAAIKGDIEGGLNSFIDEQKKMQDRSAIFHLAQFDDQYEVVIPYTEISLVGAVTVSPRNMTALLDAIGKTINDVGSYLDKLPEDQRPSTVTFLVATDGLENASHEFTRERVFEMIKHQTDVYGWTFIFLGSNQDAIASGSSMAFAQGSSLTYDSTSKGVSHAFAAASAHTHATRSGQSYSFSAKERGDASVHGHTSTTTPPQPGAAPDDDDE